MSAFILVERIADSPVVPVPDRAYDFQPFLRFAQKDQVCGNLVFDSGPHFVAVNERPAGLASVRPAAEYKPSVVGPHGECRPLGICMVFHAGQVVVPVYGTQMRGCFFLIHRIVQPCGADHPAADDPVGETAFPELVFRPFLHKYGCFLGRIAAVITFLLRGVRNLEVGPADFLNEIFAVEQFPVHVGEAFVQQRLVAGRIVPERFA